MSDTTTADSPGNQPLGLPLNDLLGPVGQLSEDSLRKKLRSLSKALGTQEALAKRLGVGPAYLSDVMSGNKAPGRSIYEALGLERVVKYRRASRA